MKLADITIPEDELLDFIDELGIEINGETSTDVLCYCPFHGNSDTPAFNISKGTNHMWRCWNPSCGAKGNIYTLVERIHDLTPLGASRYLRKYKSQRRTKKFQIKKKEKDRDYPVLDKDLLDNYSKSIWDLGYMINQRGFTMDTLQFFKVGRLGNYIVVPVFDEKFRLVGFTRRDVRKDAARKYIDADLPKKFILFNLQNAKAYDIVVVVEGPLDALKVHQAGFPNVVSVMSGNLTKYQEELLRRNFDSIIIFTDNDSAGRELGNQIANRLKQLKIYWAEYPDSKKDPGALTEEQIAQAIRDKKRKINKKIENTRRKSI